MDIQEHRFSDAYLNGLLTTPQIYASTQNIRAERKAFRMLCVIGEFTRECIAIRVRRKLKSADVIEALADLFVLRGVPAHVRSDNGPEFIAPGSSAMD